MSKQTSWQITEITPWHSADRNNTFDGKIFARISIFRLFFVFHFSRVAATQIGQWVGTWNLHRRPKNTLSEALLEAKSDEIAELSDETLAPCELSSRYFPITRVDVCDFSRIFCSIQMWKSRYTLIIIFISFNRKHSITLSEFLHRFWHYTNIHLIFLSVWNIEY